jgi:hypothetical protein
MTDQHPITPPRELVEQWLCSEDYQRGPIEQASITITTKAAQWGANQELEACCEWLAYEGHEHEHLALRAARRPEPPSLKEQALEALEALPTPAGQVTADRLATIRRALEALDD